MKRILSTMVFVWICCFSWAQVFYGDVINSENFDDATSFANSWTEVNEVPSSTTKWQLSTTSSFTNVDPSSVASGYLRVEYEEKPAIKLTKEVSLTGKSGITIGFYGSGVSGMHPSLCFKLRISKDGGTNWTDIFNSVKDGGSGEDHPSNWSLFKIFLPSEYNGVASLKIQITVDGPDYKGYGSDIYIDNFFVSERYKVDPIITNINYDQKYPTTGGYSNEEPIVVDFENGGTNNITSINMNYQIDDGNIITETYTPSTAIVTDNTGQYSFLQKADLSTPGKEYKIKVWIDVAGDSNMNNNTLTGYAENITINVPHIPTFVEYDEDQEMWYLTADSWVVENNSEDGAAWDVDLIFNIGTWSVDNEDEDSNTDLISRPIHFETGKTYEIGFSAFTNSPATAADKLNSMKVYASNKGNIDGVLKELYSNTAINDKNALNRFVRYKAEKTGAHCIVFRCNSLSTADKLMLQHISIVEAKKTDVGVSTLLSPEINKYEYTSTETVSVNVRNFGTEQIAANTVAIKMQLNDGTVTSEKVASAINPAAEVIHTFIAKINPSDQNSPQILKIWVDLANDEVASNNSVEYRVESIVTGVPYIPTEEIDFRYNWKPVDNNGDFYTFYLRDEPQLGKGKWGFAYGGSVGINGVTLLKSNESLFSRQIRLSAGNTYKMAYQVRVGKLSMPLRVELYKINGSNKSLISTISTLDIDNTTFAEKECMFEITADGIYEIAYAVEHEIPINYQIYLGDFKVTKMADHDIEAKESTLTITNISCYNKLQVGILVKNAGAKTLNNFKIKAESPSIGIKEQSFSVEILPNESRLCFFDDIITFNVINSEELVLSAILDSDTNLSNNSIISTLNHIEPATSSYYSGLLYSGADMVIIDHNKDARSFKVDLSQNRGMKYSGAAGIVADDELISRCITMKSDATYKLDFSYMVDNPGDTAQLKVFAYNNATSESLEIVDLRNIDVKSKFMGYFKVPKDGDYSICFKVYGETESLRLMNYFSVSTSVDMPDIEAISIEVPEEKVFTNNETIKVKLKSIGLARLQSFPVVLDVNGVKYYSICQGIMSQDREDFATFNNVNLSTPGDYTIKATAEVSADLTIANNTITKTTKSLPVVDLTVVSLDKPKSGSLSAEQQVAVTVKNSGKGALINIPVSCTVSDAKTTLTGVIAGPLNDGASIQYTFDETVNMYEEKTYEISVTVTAEGDVNIGDNTLATSVVCTQAPFDAGATAILSPVDGLLTANEQVKIKVKNYCTVDLFDVPVKASVGSQVITGSIPKVAVGQEVEYTFTQTVDMSKYGMYTLKASTILDGDANTANDEFSKDIKSYKIDVGVIEILTPISGENLGIQQVKVAVKNFGDVAVSNIPVEYKVTALAQFGTVTSEIAPGATVEFTFPLTYNFSEGKTYTITAYTNYEQDMDNTNNQSTKEVTNTKKKVDIAVMAIVSPVSGVLTDKESLTVTVKNLGEAAISSIPIECDIDGVVTKETITTTLAIGAETNYTFTKTFDMSSVKKYNVKVTAKAVDDANKTNDVIEQVIENLVGISDVENSLQLNIYPNPVKDVLNIVGDYTLLEIYDAAGKLVITANGEAKVDVRNLPNGVYVVKAYNNDKVGTYKVIK